MNRPHACLRNAFACLTLLFVAAQLIFFAIHYQVSDITDSLVTSALFPVLFSPVILLPILGFLTIQIIAYVLFNVWIAFITLSCAIGWKFSSLATYVLGIFLWTIGSLAILSLNNYFYPHSFFHFPFSASVSFYFALIPCIMLLIPTLCAYYHFFYHRQYYLLAYSLLTMSMLWGGLSLSDQIKEMHSHPISSTQPNIILIGFDSLRPDFINAKNTPTIAQFLQTATVFTEAYTPLARTFPAWVSILTGQYPKHHLARNNLVNNFAPGRLDTLAKRLQHAGYTTLYATDEKRFSNITQDYGFNQILGPKMGVNDFLLGSLSDLPLTNLLVNTRIGQLLLPYNYANRAAAITYSPKQFLHLIQFGLAQRDNKPVLLAIHFCVSHWPHTWANDHQAETTSLPDKYRRSVEEVDAQFRDLLISLKHEGLLENSMVVLLSDHGTGLGLVGDRLTAKSTYLGDPDKLHWLRTFTTSSLSDASPHLDTSYGQGTDVLSTQQYHVLLAMRGFGIKTIPQQIKQRSSLIDIAPTLLDVLQLPSLANSDGMTLKPFLFSATTPPQSRPLLLESGYALVELQQSTIDIHKVLKTGIHAYQINSRTGLLSFSAAMQKNALLDKQQAILLDDWLLAHYPKSTGRKLLSHRDHTLTFTPIHFPSYYILANLKTKQWSIDFPSPLEKKAPMDKLVVQFHLFQS